MPRPKRSESGKLFTRARAVLPGGVDSPVRAFGAVGGEPPFIERARGARIRDVDGRTYIDYVMSWGPLIHGHAPPDLVRALRAAAGRGTSFGAPTAQEVELARLVCRVVPSIERVRFVNSGTEATMSAIRVARAATGRDRIVKFAGCYHGHGDAFLVQAGSGATTLGVPTSPGVARGTAADTLIAHYNDLESVDRVCRAHRGKVAAVILEPIAGNMGVVPPAPGFLEGLRQLCDDGGILLVFDEVISGFRAARGGAQAVYGVRPDLTCLGKIIGGGLPVGAYGGRADLMAQVAPAGPVYQAGTLAGNPLAMTAGIWALFEPVRNALPASGGARRPACGRSPGCGARGRRRAHRQRGRLGPDPVLQRGSGDGLRLGHGGGHRRVRDVLPRDAAARHLSPALPVRGLVPVGRALRARRRHHRPRGAPVAGGRRGRRPLRARA